MGTCDVCSTDLTLKRTEVYGYRLCETDAKDLHNRRVWARLIDSVIFNGASLLIGFGLGWVYGTGAITLEALGTLSLAVGVVVAALALTMDSWFDGSSIGKRSKGLTVITLENKRAGLSDSIKRNAIFLLGWIHVAASLILSLWMYQQIKQGKRLGDGGTMVVPVDWIGANGLLIRGDVFDSYEGPQAEAA